MFAVDDLDLVLDDDFPTGIFGAKNVKQKENVVCDQRSDGGNTNIPIEVDKRRAESTSRAMDSSSFVNCILQPSPVSTPARKHSRCRESLRQRKFPGPAGLLPDTPPRDFRNTSMSLNHTTEATPEREERVIYSQDSASVFREPPFEQLIEEYELHDSSNPLTNYTIDWVKKKVMSKSLNGHKIPFLAVVLHSINASTPDPILVLRDPTGQLYGTLYRDVWTEINSKLHAGAALVLRQVGVLRTGASRRRQVHLNITSNNLVAVYSVSAEDAAMVTVERLQRISQAELRGSVARWQAGLDTPANQTSQSLFSSVGTTLDNSTTYFEDDFDVSSLSETDTLPHGEWNKEKSPNWTPKTKKCKTQTRHEGLSGLSQEDSLIFQDALSGVDLNDLY